MDKIRPNAGTGGFHRHTNHACSLSSSTVSSDLSLCGPFTSISGMDSASLLGSDRLGK
jgi:hypothetical protein